MTAGRQTFTPFLVGPGTATYDSFVQQVTTAQSGGALTYMISLYQSDLNGMPDTITGPLVTYANTAPAASTGLKVYAFNGSLTSIQLQPGIYWISCLQVVSTAPTTAPVWLPLNNSTWSIPLVSSTTALTNNIRGYYIASRNTMYSNAAFTAATVVATAGLDMPYTALRHSA